MPYIANPLEGIPIRNSFIVDQANLGAAAALDDTLLIYDISATALKQLTVSNLQAGILASPTFTGVPAAPTAGAGTNTTQLATTAFVTTATTALNTITEMTDVTISSIGSGEILKWNGSAWINNDLSEAGILPVAGPTFTGVLTVGSAVISEADLEQIDDLTAGTAVASKALVVNSNKDIGTLRNLTIDGVFTDGNYTFDTSGNVSGLGTVASGTHTIGSLVVAAASITDSTGTISFGDENLTTTGIVTAGGITIGSAVLIAAELELLDGLTAGTAIASKVVTTDSNIDTTGQRNLTITGELDAATLDISGSADIDGTLEADIITVDGVALSTYIRDTVGTNMLSSNTESGIAVTYDTSNDNIDFALDAAQTIITSVYNASLKVGRDADNLIDFATTDNKIILRVNGVNEVELVENALSPVTSDGIALGTASLMWSDLFLASAGVINFNAGNMTITHATGSLTVAGGTLATAALTTTTIVASGIVKTDSTTNATSTTDGSIQTDGGLSVVLDAVFGDDVKLLSDAAVIHFGGDADVTLTHVHNAGLLLDGTKEFQFYASTQKIYGNSDTLHMAASTEIDLTATTIDINGNVEISGSLTPGSYVSLPTAAVGTSGIVNLASVGETNTGTSTTLGVTPDGLSGAVRTIVLTAGGGSPLTTAGCEPPEKIEAASNDINYWVLGYDTSTEEHAFWNIQMPDSYDGGVLNATFVWTNTGGSSSQTVVWGIAGRAFTNDDAIDQALGTEVTVSDTWIAQGDVHISATSGNITLSGSPAGGQWVNMVVARKVGSDNMSGDARLLSVKLEYTIDQYSD